MAGSTAQSPAIWALVARQHGVVGRRQLLELGVSRRAIEHRLRTGRLRSVSRGVYVVGRPELSREGRWMTAALACGPGAVLSHRSAGALWGFASEHDAIELSVVAPRAPRRRGTVVHRRSADLADDATVHRSIPVTRPAPTLLDLATRLTARSLETAINEADRLDLIDPEGLRVTLDSRPGRPGVARLRGLLDRATFTLTDSELERRFLPLARRAGLPSPLTRQRVSGFKVDFFWPALGLVVETDGLRYHRTAAQQSRDRRRDQAHTAAGLTQLRFSHAQVRYEPRYVEATLARVAGRLARRIISSP